MSRGTYVPTQATMLIKVAEVPNFALGKQAIGRTLSFELGGATVGTDLAAGPDPPAEMIVTSINVDYGPDAEGIITSEPVLVSFEQGLFLEAAHQELPKKEEEP